MADMANSFEPGDGSDDMEFEIIDGEQPQQAAAKKKVEIDEDEYERLRQGSASTSEAFKSVSQLADEIRASRGQERIIVQQAPAPIQRESSSDRLARVYSGTDEALNEINRIIDERIDPYVQGVQSELGGVHHSIFSRDEQDGPIIQKYGKEIQELIASVPPVQRGLKSTYKWALDQVKVAHLDDIANERAAKIIADKGGEPAPVKQNGQRANAPHMERGGVAPAVGARPKQTIYITDKDRQTAARYSMPLDTPEQKQRYHEIKTKRGW